MSNNNCKKCGSDQYVKNGKVRSEQRYQTDKSCIQITNNGFSNAQNLLVYK